MKTNEESWCHIQETYRMDMQEISDALAQYDMSANPLRINTKHPEWYIKEHMIYPPFKQGLYLEEYFFKYLVTRNEGVLDRDGRTYFPLFWTNYQLSAHASKSQLSADIEEYMQLHPPIHPEKGYFTVVQHDDGPLVVHPRIHVYGASQGHTPLPLIYEDQNHTLANTTAIEDQPLLCSFVGSMTHAVRQRMLKGISESSKNPPDLVVEGYTERKPSDKEQRQDDIYVHVQHWTPVVSPDDASLFIHITRHSKFTLAPRGYGIQSYRFYEAFELGSIPVYIHDTPPPNNLWSEGFRSLQPSHRDIRSPNTTKSEECTKNDTPPLNNLWLPYQDQINYHDICIVLHVSDIDTLIPRLRSITPEQYHQMRENYKNIKHMFTLDYMCEYIRRNNA